jgi:membrane-associated phospholipid phosphatase
MQTILYYDYLLFQLINGTWHHPFFDAIIPLWRDEFFWMPLYLFFILFVCLNYRKQAPYILLFAVITIVLCDQTASNLIKPFFARLRPCRESFFSETLHLLVPCGSGKSFVSAHATNHFGIATYIWLVFRHDFKWLLPVAFFWAASIAYGQVYVGVHYPSDVICGGILGILIGAWTGYWVKQLAKYESNNSPVVQ